MAFAATPRQMDLLRYVAGFQEAHGISPSMEECRRVMRLRSKTCVGRMLNALEERGWISRMPNRARAIEVLHKPVIPRAPDGAPLYFVRA